MIAAILAKGGSERLGGADKPLLMIDGVTLLDRAIAAVRPCVNRIVVVTQSDSVKRHAAALPGVTVVADAEPGAGPLAALVTALDEARGEPVLLLACDLPFIESEPLRRLIAAHGDAVATAVVVGDRVQPLCAVYSPRVRAMAGELGADPKAGLMRLLDRAGGRRIPAPDLGWTPGARWFDDVDTWESYRAIAGAAS